MATNAITALGTTLAFNSNTIGEITSLTGTRTARAVEILSCDSTDNVVEIIAGAINEGEVSFHIIYDGSAAGVYNDLNTDFLARTIATCLITFSDTSSISASGMITNLGLPSFNEGDGSVELDVTIKFNGKITFTDVP